MKLSDARAARTQYSPGDRVIVHAARVDDDIRRKLSRAAARFTGEDVRVLVVDTARVRMATFRGGKSEELTSPGMEVLEPPLPGVANVRIGAVDLRPGTVLAVVTNYTASDNSRFVDWVRHWSGKDVEVISR